MNDIHLFWCRYCCHHCCNYCCCWCGQWLKVYAHRALSIGNGPRYSLYWVKRHGFYSGKPTKVFNLIWGYTYIIFATPEIAVAFSKIKADLRWIKHLPQFTEDIKLIFYLTYSHLPSSSWRQQVPMGVWELVACQLFGTVSISAE